MSVKSIAQIGGVGYKVGKVKDELRIPPLNHHYMIDASPSTFSNKFRQINGS